MTLVAVGAEGHLGFAKKSGGSGSEESGTWGLQKNMEVAGRRSPEPLVSLHKCCV